MQTDSSDDDIRPDRDQVIDARRTPPGCPGPWSGLGTVALYFLLQFGVAVAAVTVLGVAAALNKAATHGALSRQQLRAAMESALAQPGMHAILAIASVVIAAAITVLFVRRAWPAQWSRAEPHGFGLTAARQRSSYLVAVVLGVAIVFLGGVLTQLLARGQPVEQDVTLMAAGVSLYTRIALAVLVVCVAPFVEELVFRGVLLSGLATRMRVRWAIAGSALVFGTAHLGDFGFAWYPIPQLVLLGLVLGWLRVRSGSLWPSITLHATNNLIAVIGWIVVQYHL